jgi:hypothetical protein
MKYEEALKRWGASQINMPKDATWKDVSVTFDWDEGFACCGGTNPGCYCSYARSPSFEVSVSCFGIIYTRDLQWDMDSFLQELFEVSE